MSGKRVLAVYAALLLGFAVVLCRLYLLALHPAYAARAAAQSTVTLQLPARRGNFYDAQGRLLTGLEERWQVVCFPGQGNYDRLYACTDAAGQALLYRSRSRAAPFLLEVSCDPARLGLTGYPTARRYAAVPLCQHLLGYLDSTGHGAAGLEKALDAVLSGTGENSSLVCAVTAQGTLRTGETARLLQADSGALGVQLTISRPVQRAVEAVAASTMTSGCILVLDTATAAVRASVSVPCYDPEHLADSLQAENSPFLNRALQSYAVGSVFKPVLAATALEAGLQPVFECTGAVVVDGQIFRCAGGVPHGQVDLAAALEKSCNGYFIRLGQQLGAESLLDAAKAFGFGQSLLLAEGFAAEAGQTTHARQTAAEAGQSAQAPRAAAEAGQAGHAFARLHDRLHHFTHLIELLEQLIDVLHAGAGPLRDARAAAAVEQVGLLALGLGHGGVVVHRLAGAGRVGELVQKLAPEHLFVLPLGRFPAPANGDQELAVVLHLHSESSSFFSNRKFMIFDSKRIRTHPPARAAPLPISVYEPSVRRQLAVTFVYQLQ